jgi:hypothetical protein
VKKTTRFLAAGTLLLLLGGCTPLVKPPEGVDAEMVRIGKRGEHEYSFSYNGPKLSGKTRKERAEIPLLEMKRVMHEIAKFGLVNGYRCMAIVNTRTNNVAGFPFNDWKNFERYARLSPLIRGNGHFTPIVFGKGNKVPINDGHVCVYILYFKEAHPGLFLWDLEQLEKETV